MDPRCLPTILLLLTGCASTAAPARDAGPPLVAPATRPTGDVDEADVYLQGAALDLREYRAAARSAGLSDADVAFVDGVVDDQQKIIDQYGGNLEAEAAKERLEPWQLAVEVRNAVQSRAYDAIAKRPEVYEPWLTDLGRHDFVALAAEEAPEALAAWLGDAGASRADVERAMALVRETHGELGAARKATRDKSATPADGVYYLRRNFQAKQNLAPQVAAALPPKLRPKWTAFLDGLLLDGTAARLKVVQYERAKRPSEVAPPAAVVTSDDVIQPDVPPGTYELFAVGNPEPLDRVTVGKGETVGFVLDPDFLAIKPFSSGGKYFTGVRDHLHYWQPAAANGP